MIQIAGFKCWYKYYAYNRQRPQIVLITIYIHKFDEQPN